MRRSADAPPRSTHSSTGNCPAFGHPPYSFRHPSYSRRHPPYSGVHPPPNFGHSLRCEPLSRHSDGHPFRPKAASGRSFGVPSYSGRRPCLRVGVLFQADGRVSTADVQICQADGHFETQDRFAGTRERRANRTNKTNRLADERLSQRDRRTCQAEV